MRSRELYPGLVVAVAAAALAGASDAGRQGAVADERPFVAENAAAMGRMMTDMSVAPTGDPDVDFAAVMIPHHQGAIDMAASYLRYGRDERLRRLAQEIVIEQQQEIAVMQRTLDGRLSASAPALCTNKVAPTTETDIQGERPR